MFEAGNTAGLRHGHAKQGGRTPEYHCWVDIKGRCLNPNMKFYKDYGGRGIKVCDKWKDDFLAFLADVGLRPSPLHTIDRHPNNDGNYEPGNVRWATRDQQVANRRSTRMVMLDGSRIPVSEACRRLGLNRKTVCGRIDRGWAPEDAITPPLWRRS
jgi:hypothetical protein